MEMYGRQSSQFFKLLFNTHENQLLKFRERPSVAVKILERSNSK